MVHIVCKTTFSVLEYKSRKGAFTLGCKKWSWMIKVGLFQAECWLPGEGSWGEVHPWRISQLAGCGHSYESTEPGVSCVRLWMLSVHSACHCGTSSLYSVSWVNFNLSDCTHQKKRENLLLEVLSKTRRVAREKLCMSLRECRVAQPAWWHCYQLWPGCWKCGECWGKLRGLHALGKGVACWCADVL